ncbi:MAG TPA: carboxymuconolactone decarboxylase family protein [Acidimicrobiales bacterium]|nr:carboxymuconolactone decarboxylase family protein [Acidimicrobiales bacterium]
MSAPLRVELPEGDGDEIVRLFTLNPDMGVVAAAFSGKVYEKSRLDIRERELVRMRIARINDCSVCIDTRTADPAAAGLSEDLYQSIEDWRTLPGLTDRERVAVEYAERYALDHRNLDDELWARLRSLWSDEEILDLTVCISAFLALGRMISVLGPTPACPVVLD